MGVFTKTPPKDERERIMVYGGSGVGKSFSILQLAQTIAMFDKDSQVYIIDSDDGIRKVWKRHFPQVQNVNWALVTNWEQVQEAVDDIQNVVRPNDWVAIDMLGKFWEMAQSHEVNEVYGTTASEYMIVARAEAVAAAKHNKPATLPGHDWNVIKKLHNGEFIDKIVTEFGCNVYVTTGPDPLIPEFDDQKVLSMFGMVGYKPDGEKKNPHRFDTVAFMRMLKDGTRIFSTVKDRARPLMNDVSFTNFITDYHQALISLNCPGIFPEDEE